MKTFLTAFCLLFGFGLAQASAQNTYFTDGDPTFSSLGQWQTQRFTISQQRTFVMRFAADYKADFSIIKATQLDNFRNNRGFTGYGNFDNSFGTHSVTLGAGTYYIAVRNQISGTNSVRWELDYNLTVTGYRFVQSGIRATQYVGANGGKMWHQFTITPGYRYYIDGCNSGLQTDVIPSSSLSNYRNNLQYTYYPSLSGSTTDLPGFYRLNLAAGTYDLCFYNLAGNSKAVTYLMSIFR